MLSNTIVIGPILADSVLRLFQFLIRQHHPSPFSGVGGVACVGGVRDVCLLSVMSVTCVT